MFAAIRKAAPFAAIAVAAILAGCTVAPAPYYDDVYAYSGPSTVFVGPCCYYGGYYDRFHHYGPGNHWNGGGGVHGVGGGGMHGGGHR
jgi:hypothetical protein